MRKMVKLINQAMTSTAPKGPTHPTNADQMNDIYTTTSRFRERSDINQPQFSQFTTCNSKSNQMTEIQKAKDISTKDQLTEEQSTEDRVRKLAITRALKRQAPRPPPKYSKVMAKENMATIDEIRVYDADSDVATTPELPERGSILGYADDKSSNEEMANELLDDAGAPSQKQMDKEDMVSGGESTVLNIDPDDPTSHEPQKGNVLGDTDTDSDVPISPELEDTDTESDVSPSPEPQHGHAFGHTGTDSDVPSSPEPQQENIFANTDTESDVPSSPESQQGHAFGHAEIDSDVPSSPEPQEDIFANTATDSDAPSSAEPQQGNALGYTDSDSKVSAMPEKEIGSLLEDCKLPDIPEREIRSASGHTDNKDNNQEVIGGFLDEVVTESQKREERRVTGELRMRDIHSEKQVSLVDDQQESWSPQQDLPEEEQEEHSNGLITAGGKNMPTFFHIFPDNDMGCSAKKKKTKKPNGKIGMVKKVLGSLGKTFSRRNKELLNGNWVIQTHQQYDDPPEGMVFEVERVEKRPVYAYNSATDQLVLIPGHETVIITKDGLTIRESALTKVQNIKPKRVHTRTVKAKDIPVLSKPIVNSGRQFAVEREAEKASEKQVESVRLNKQDFGFTSSNRLKLKKHTQLPEDNDEKQNQNPVYTTDEEDISDGDDPYSIQPLAALNKSTDQSIPKAPSPPPIQPHTANEITMASISPPVKPVSDIEISSPPPPALIKPDSGHNIPMKALLPPLKSRSDIEIPNPPSPALIKPDSGHNIPMAPPLPPLKSHSDIEITNPPPPALIKPDSGHNIPMAPPLPPLKSHSDIEITNPPPPALIKPDSGHNIPMAPSLPPLKSHSCIEIPNPPTPALIKPDSGHNIPLEPSLPPLNPHSYNAIPMPPPLPSIKSGSDNGIPMAPTPPLIKTHSDNELSMASPAQAVKAHSTKEVPMALTPSPMYAELLQRLQIRPFGSVESSSYRPVHFNPRKKNVPERNRLIIYTGEE